MSYFLFFVEDLVRVDARTGADLGVLGADICCNRVPRADLPGADVPASPATLADPRPRAPRDEVPLAGWIRTCQTIYL